MKRLLQAIGLLTVLMVMNAVTFLIMFGTPDTRAQGPDDPVGFIPGDINCDGAADLSDAIGLLSYLFDGGLPPTACAQPEEPPAALTQEELIEALVAARGVYEPKPEDYLVEIVANSVGTVEVFEVDEGKVFFITHVIRPSASARIKVGGVSIGNPAWPFDGSKQVRIPVFAGQTLEVIPFNDGQTLITGYFMDVPLEED